MNIKNNIEIIKLDDFGRGICYIDNKITFIPNTIPNEIVDIDVIKETSKYNEGKVIKYKKKSDKRIEVLCPFYKDCGGCNLLHISYKDQINYKKEKLKNILNKFSKIEIDIEVIKNDNELGYRNKIDLKIENKLWGYYNNNTHDFISIDKCLLVSDSINEVINNKDLFNINNGSIIIRSNYNDEILISINSKDEINIDIEKLKQHIKLVGIVLNDKVYYGEDYFFEMFNNKLFKVKYDSFFQVNRYITNEMINILNKYSYGKTLLDLYCGVGFLGQSIDYKYDKIYGIEINKNSILNAINNANINKIDNAYYMCGDSKNIVNIKDKIDTLFIDPPRTGLVSDLVIDVINIKSKRIIYISCNPITLSRDLNMLKEYYDIKKIYLLDMFSNTYHIESIVILERKIQV